MNNTKLVGIIVVILACFAILFWIFLYPKLESPSLSPEEGREVLESLTAPTQEVDKALTPEQKAALKSLTAPEKPPQETSSEEMEAILKSLEAR